MSYRVNSSSMSGAIWQCFYTIFFGECRWPGGDNKKISERQWMLRSTVDIVIYGIGVSVQSAPTLSKASTFEISYFTQECFIRLLSLFILISVSSVLLLSVSLCIVFLWGTSFISYIVFKNGGGRGYLKITLFWIKKAFGSLYIDPNLSPPYLFLSPSKNE